MSRKIVYLAGALAALALVGGGVASGDSDDGGGGGGGTGGTGGTSIQPPGTIAVNFTVDDTANKTFAGDGTAMEWKGSFKYNAATRVVELDSTWMGPYPPMFDDGPWNAGGHEPAGSVAGDHKLGITVFIAPPEEGETNFEYGLLDAVLAGDDKLNKGWIWTGNGNGKFSVKAGATAAITADGMTVAPFGTIDMRLVLDTEDLGEGNWDTSKVEVKGSGWAWSNVELKDDGQNGDETADDGKFTFLLSNTAGKGIFTNVGLLKSGNKPEFIFVLNGTEYKDAGGTAQTTGVTAGTGTGGTFTDATISVAENKNTFITVP